jgi:hypothetical protein
MNRLAKVQGDAVVNYSQIRLSDDVSTFSLELERLSLPMSFFMDSGYVRAMALPLVLSPGLCLSAMEGS